MYSFPVYENVLVVIQIINNKEKTFKVLKQIFQNM